jgi:hypothetical protein
MRALLAAFVLALSLAACSFDPDRTSSPTTRFVAVRSHVSASVVTFVIEDGYGHRVFAPPDRFTEPVVIAWDADERLWIRSPAGVIVWTPRHVGGDWAPMSAADQAALALPAALTAP